MMKFLIIKVEYITDGEKTVCRQEIPTEDIEKTRKELHGLVKCDTIYFTYHTEEKYNF